MEWWKEHFIYIKNKIFLGNFHLIVNLDLPIFILVTLNLELILLLLKHILGKMQSKT